MVCYATQNNLLKPAEGNSGAIPSCVTTSVGFFIGDKMKRIPLTQNQFAIVDDNMFEYLNQWKWYAKWNKHTNSFYAVRGGKTIKGKRQNFISMARVILGLNYGDKRQADHLDHNTLDNRISNLRVVTNQQNHYNQKNTKGYCWHKPCQKYLARIKLNGKDIHLGYFRTVKEAHNAYLEAKKRYHNIKLEELKG